MGKNVLHIRIIVMKMQDANTIIKNLSTNAPAILALKGMADIAQDLVCENTRIFKNDSLFKIKYFF